MYEELGQHESYMAIADRIDEADGFTALGGCVFAGGFTFGMEQAGFNIAGHLEFPELNIGADVSRQRWPVAEGDLNAWIEIAEDLTGNELVPDVFYANPPCSAYCGPGRHGGLQDDIMRYVRHCTYQFAMVLAPPIWCWELVPSIMNDRGFLDAMAFRASRMGYKCYAFLTTSALHGGYQDRRRFHFVATRVELDFEGVYEMEPSSKKGVRALGQMLSTLKNDRVDKALEDPDCKVSPSDASPEEVSR
ncbi:hypothetical protein LCGC14_2785390, partial [marine sediment metagenome]